MRCNVMGCNHEATAYADLHRTVRTCAQHIKTAAANGFNMVTGKGAFRQFYGLLEWHRDQRMKREANSDG